MIKCNYRHEPWMTDDVKTKLKERSKFTKKYYKYSYIKSDIAKSNECAEAISTAKNKCIKQMCEKLNDPLAASYWEILNHLLNNKKDPVIPPLLVNDEIISNSLKKLFIRLDLKNCPFAVTQPSVSE